MAKKKVFQISNALAEGLEETVNAAHNYHGELRVDVISLKKLELDPENPRDMLLTLEDAQRELSEDDKDYARKSQEKDSLQTLANSIKTQGILNPIIVYKYGDKYRLIAGERRSLASTLAGKTDIQAKVLDSKPNELKISLLQWMENVERKDLSLWERLRNLEKILSAYASQKNMTSFHDINSTDLGRMLGCSLPHAMNYKAVLTANTKIQELVRSNKLKNLEKAALLAGIKSHDIQQSAIDACLSGAPLKKLKVLATQDKPKHAHQARLAAAKADGRGRQPSLVNFGVTKNIGVARIVVDSLLRHEKVSHLNQYFTELNWNDYRSVSHAFKQLLLTLEKIEA